MKNSIIIFFALLSMSVFSQNTIKFSHDAGGNMTQRYTRNMNLRIGKTDSDSLLSFKVYPNPTKDYVTVEGNLSDTKPASIFIYDVNGALLKQDTYDGVKKTFQLNGYTNGIYFLELKYADKKSTNYRLVITE